MASGSSTANRKRPAPPTQPTGTDAASGRSSAGNDTRDDDDDGAVAEGTTRRRPRTAPSTPPKQHPDAHEDGKRQRSPKINSESKRNKKAAKASKATLKRKWATAPTTDKRTCTDIRLHFAAPPNVTSHARGTSSPDGDSTPDASTPASTSTQAAHEAEDGPGAAASGIPMSTSEPAESGEIRPATPAELAREEPGHPQASPRPHGRVPTTSTDRREDQPG